MLLEIDGDIILDKEKLRKRYEETNSVNSVEEYVDTDSREILNGTNSNLDEKASSEGGVNEDEFLEPDSEEEDGEIDSEWVLGDTDNLNGAEDEETYNEEVLDESEEINSAGEVLNEFLEHSNNDTDNSGEELNNEGVQGDINSILDEDEFIEPDSVDEETDSDWVLDDTNSTSDEDEETYNEEVQDNISTSDEDEFLEPDSEDTDNSYKGEETDSEWMLDGINSTSYEYEFLEPNNEGISNSYEYGETNSKEVTGDISNTSDRGINDCTEPDISKIENEKQVVEVEKTSLDKEKINSEEENTTNIPTDLREFVKLNRFCDISLALQYFSKKEIEKQLCLGRVYKRKNKLFI